MRTLRPVRHCRNVAKTFLVECFWPGVTEPAHAEAAVRAEAAARELRSGGHGVRFLGSTLVPHDEVAFYRFAADSSGDVERASTLAELPFDRVLEYVEAPEPDDGD